MTAKHESKLAQAADLKSRTIYLLSKTPMTSPQWNARVRRVQRVRAYVVARACEAQYAALLNG